MDKLNAQQEKAIQHVEGPLLVLAGAGSGKTHVVTQRIAQLLSLGIPASEIVALTFTNKAAEEMRARVKKATSQSVLICTFHALGVKILRESIAAIGYKPNFTIYDQADSEQLVGSCLTLLQYKKEKGLVKTLKSQISNAKNALLLPHQVDFAATKKDNPFKEIYFLYQEKLQEYNALDFDDLLFKCVELFQKCPAILEVYQNRWSFLLIDEYQDTNQAQYTLAQYLVAKHQNIFAVGDPDQSIYSWRGANINNILNFSNDFKGAVIIPLEQNYRSTNHILQGANSVIKHNKERLDKSLWSDLGIGEKIQVFVAANEREEMEFVLNHLLKLQQQHQLLFNQCAILYRTNAQSRILEDGCIRRQIPYIIIGGISFYQRREIKDMLAYLRIALSPTDLLSFLRVVNLPKRGIGKTTLNKIQQACQDHSLSVIALCRHLLESNASFKLSAKQRIGLKDFLHVVSSIQTWIEGDTPLYKLIEQAIDTSNYLNYLKEDPDTLDERQENLQQLVNKAREWEEEHQAPSLQTFLEELSLKASIDETKHSHQSVRLMTLHNGKGLEFPLVFIIGMEENLLPHINSKESLAALEEERRLCYVGMTRAKKFLYLTGCRYRNMWGIPRIMEPSRFLSEIDEMHFSYVDQGQEKGAVGGLFVGTTVCHKDFGRGVIKKVYETSLGTTYDIHFQGDQTARSLVAKYAKLTLPDSLVTS